MKDTWVGNIYNNRVKLTLPPLVAWIKDNLDDSDNFFSPCGTWGRTTIMIIMLSFVVLVVFDRKCPLGGLDLRQLGQH